MDCSTLNDTVSQIQSNLDFFQSELIKKNALISKLETDIQRLNDLQTRTAQSPVYYYLTLTNV